jgi:hypothetical protein
MTNNAPFFADFSCGRMGSFLPRRAETLQGILGARGCRVLEAKREVWEELERAGTVAAASLTIFGVLCKAIARDS